MDREPAAEHDLPGDLDALEETLLSRCRSASPVALRARVLAGLRSERRREEARARWSFAALVAAVAAIWINVTAISSLRSALSEARSVPEPSVAALAEDIRRVLPQIGEGEAVRYAVIHGARPRPGPCALPPGTARWYPLRNPGDSLAP